MHWLHTHHRSRSWLAARLGVSVKHVSQIINGRSGYSPDLAMKIAEVTNMSTLFWVRLQSDPSQRATP
jgi:addiction module HigA family antidote